MNDGFTPVHFDFYLHSIIRKPISAIYYILFYASMYHRGNIMSFEMPLKSEPKKWPRHRNLGGNFDKFTYIYPTFHMNFHIWISHRGCLKTFLNLFKMLKIFCLTHWNTRFQFFVSLWEDENFFKKLVLTLILLRSAQNEKQ